MGYKVGNIIPQYMYVGDSTVKRVYKGDNLEWDRESLSGKRFNDATSADIQISQLRGKSLVWNQQINQKVGTYTTYGITAVFGEDGYVTLSGTATANVDIMLVNNFDSSVIGHKYLILYKGNIALSEDIQIGNNYLAAPFRWTESTIVTATFNRSAPKIVIANGITVNGKFALNIFDLTIMFGTGNEPSTVEEFEAMYPLPYYDYNTGTIINNNASAIESIGFNQWDEEWELGGINSNTGNVDSSYTDYIHSSNFIPCDNSKSYYIKRPLDSGHLNGYLYFYDDSKTYLGSSSRVLIYNTSGKEFSIPANAAYMKFAIQYSTYNHDICINISNPALNGTYKPYKKDTLTLNLSTIKGKLNGEGESVTIFPDGMRSAGTVYDYIIVDDDGYARKAVKVMKSVDLGSLAWKAPWWETSGRIYVALNGKANGYRNIIYPLGATVVSDGDLMNKVGICGNGRNNLVYVGDAHEHSTADAFIASLSGVYAYYELATPETYVLDEPILMTYHVENGGLTQILPEDTTSSVCAPIDMDIARSIIHD